VLCQQALPLLRQAGDRDSEAGTWDSIGYACHHLGDYQQAVVSYQNALELARAIGNSHLEADILDHLSNTLLRTASYQAAQHVLRQAFAILDRLGHPSAASVQAKLARTLARAGQAGGPPDHQLADRLVFAKGAVGR
jgi:tetratricopeptide (TPR) repeat protein